MGSRSLCCKNKLSAFGEIKEWKLEETPGFGISILTALMPVILMAISTIYSIATNDGKPFAAVTTSAMKAGKVVTTTTYPSSFVENVMMFIGNPVSAMIISLLFALVTMGWMQRKKILKLQYRLQIQLNQLRCYC